jgi:hypothetical protein
VFKTVASFILIICLLFSQASEAYFVAQIPCAQEHATLSALDNAELTNLSNQHAVMQTMQMDNNGENCCQEECCCTFGLLSPALLVDISISPSAKVNSSQPSNIATALNMLVLSQLQKPPKARLFS